MTITLQAQTSADSSTSLVSMGASNLGDRSSFVRPLAETSVPVSIPCSSPIIVYPQTGMDRLNSILSSEPRQLGERFKRLLSEHMAQPRMA